MGARADTNSYTGITVRIRRTQTTITMESDYERRYLRLPEMLLQTG